MKKRVFSLLLALVMALSLFACGGDSMVGITVIGGSDEPTDIIVTDDSDDGSIEAVPDDGMDADDLTDNAPPEGLPEDELGEDDYLLDEEGWYYSAEDVSEYLWTYGYLPGNFITKNEARDLGWEGGSVEDHAGKGYAIGGDKFGNREGLLPKAEGRQYYECDIDTAGASSRGAKRLVFSNDGLIYYTEDHYESFELLYGEE